MKKLIVAVLLGACLAPLLADAQVCVQGKRITNDFKAGCRGEVVYYRGYVWSDEERAQVAEYERRAQERANQAHAAEQRAAADQAKRDQREWAVWEMRSRGASAAEQAEAMRMMERGKLSPEALRAQHLERTTGVRRSK